MIDKRRYEVAFEIAMEAHLLQNGYRSVLRGGFDRERAILPETVLAFIRETPPTAAVSRQIDVGAAV